MYQKITNIRFYSVNYPFVHNIYPQELKLSEVEKIRSGTEKEL